ncbi:cytochrome P450 78A3-like [Hibiscus syriacus]|uniref:Cytochrome P450 78A3-like n=1 Tax=Hibiscus syriacus TaxID=106335 RepID=A0A6A2WM65_HIBSY|nr:cytochrome P450 78A3-like [Hibiscus syriacus]
MGVQDYADSNLKPSVVLTGSAKESNGPSIGRIDIGVSHSAFLFRVALPSIRNDHRHDNTGHWSGSGTIEQMRDDSRGVLLSRAVHDFLNLPGRGTGMPELHLVEILVVTLSVKVFRKMANQNEVDAPTIYVQYFIPTDQQRRQRSSIIRAMALAALQTKEMITHSKSSPTRSSPSPSYTTT